jgi:hypothetical protein
VVEVDVAVVVEDGLEADAEGEDVVVVEVGGEDVVVEVEVGGEEVVDDVAEEEDVEVEDGAVEITLLVTRLRRNTCSTMRYVSWAR